MRLAIRNGRLIDPANGIDARLDLFITDGRIAAAGSAPDGFDADRVIDAGGNIVCPGFIDLRAHPREPGQEHKATIASETRAAAHGGVTTLCCPPDTDPVIDTPAVATLVRRRAMTTGMSRIIPIGALTRGLDGEHLSEMAALAEAGCAGVGNGFHPVRSPLIMLRAMEYAATFNLTVFVNPQDPALANDGKAHDGAVSTRLGLPAIPAAAETCAVAAHLALVEQTGARTHFSLLSTARAAQMIARARHDGLPVSADVSIHHLHLSENDVLDFDSLCHVQPPLRTLRDRDGLRDWLGRGVIQAICSDHQPHEPDAKLRPYGETAPGISGLETLLPLALRLVDDGVLDLATVIDRLSRQPAQILGIDGGDLGAGRRADVCIFDPERSWVLDRQALASRGHNTPFLDWEMKGRVTATVVAGRPVYQLDGEGRGR